MVVADLSNSARFAVAGASFCPAVGCFGRLTGAPDLVELIVSSWVSLIDPVSSPTPVGGHPYPEAAASLGDFAAAVQQPITFAGTLTGPECYRIQAWLQRN